MPPNKLRRAIVICTGNLNRSPFLAAMLESKGWQASSCGTSEAAKDRSLRAAKTRRIALEVYDLTIQGRTFHYTEVPKAVWELADVVIGFNKSHEAAAGAMGVAGKYRNYKVNDPGFLTASSPEFAPIYAQLKNIADEISK